MDSKCRIGSKLQLLLIIFTISGATSQNHMSWKNSGSIHSSIVLDGNRSVSVSETGRKEFGIEYGATPNFWNIHGNLKGVIPIKGKETKDGIRTQLF